jgi:hypothetical protein
VRVCRWPGSVAGDGGRSACCRGSRARRSLHEAVPRPCSPRSNAGTDMAIGMDLAVAAGAGAAGYIVRGGGVCVAANGLAVESEGLGDHLDLHALVVQACTAARRSRRRIARSPSIGAGTSWCTVSGSCAAVASGDASSVASARQLRCAATHFSTASVGSDRGALPGSLPVGFPGPPAAPGVRVSTHRALHVSCPLISRLRWRLPVSGSRGSVCCCHGSGSGSRRRWKRR